MRAGRPAIAGLLLALGGPARAGDPIVEEIRGKAVPLFAVAAATAPKVDGVLEDAWKAAPVTRVGRDPTVHLRAVYTETEIHFAAQWDDEKEDRSPEAAHLDGISLFVTPVGSNVTASMLAWVAGRGLANAAGGWRDGRWTVELHRPRKAATKTDLPIDADLPRWIMVSTTSAARMPGDGGGGVVELSLARAAHAETFDGLAAGAAPAGFSAARTGGGAEGSWIVREAPEPPSGKQVVEQADADETSYRFPLLVRDEPQAANVHVSVRFRTVSGTVDQAAGLVARYRDPDDYYVVRANALEGNVRLYRIVGGKREQFAGVDVEVTPRAWHDLALDVRGKRLRVWYDGRLLFEADDETFAGPGKTGLWTKADSVTWFDDLRVVELP